MAGEHLILTDEAGEQQQDEMFARLSQIAKPLNDDGRKRKKQIKSSGSIMKRNSDRPSSFFFKPSESFDAIIERNKQAAKPKKLKHADDDITKRTRKMRKELPPVLLQNIDDVREMFLQQIAPKTFAAQTGTLQARTVAQRLLKTDVDAKPFVQFERMVEVGMQIQMAKFVTKYMGLPAREWRNVLEALTPKQNTPREVLFMNQPPVAGQQQPAPNAQTKNPTPPSQLKTRRRIRDGNP